ncbi:MAG TPA: phosphatase domain-containing protein [Thermoanaerobaculia bacterium]
MGEPTSRERVRRGLLKALLAGDRVADRIARSGRSDPKRMMIQPYRSYGTPAVFHVRGRVLRDRGIGRATPRDTRWKNFTQTWKRVFSSEVAGARVAAVYRGKRVEGIADDEGYFHLTIEDCDVEGLNLWEQVEVSLVGEGSRGGVLVPVLVPTDRAEFGIISDIDDTVIRTEATSLVRMLRTVLLENAHVRLPFEGIAAFYRALHRGLNPIFYVSSGPWNLYDLLAEVFEILGIPAGPIFLQDWGLDEEKLIVRRHDDHKREQIEAIVATYPSLQFILIGDSGQRDPEIYEDVARRYPGRIRAIYIRDVTEGPRESAVREIATRIGTEHGIPTLLVPDTMSAARHAAANGWIASDELPAIEGEKEKDEAAGL